MSLQNLSILLIAEITDFRKIIELEEVSFE
jgi:hypothetical protein